MSTLTLDDAATLLMQLEATDTADLASLRDALTDLAFENKVPLAAQPAVARAARLLGTIVTGSAADTAATLTEVGEALEAAMRATDAARTTINAFVDVAVDRTVDVSVDVAVDRTVDKTVDATPKKRRTTPRGTPIVTPAAPVEAIAPTAAPVEAIAPTRSTAHDTGSDTLPDDADRDLCSDFITESMECIANSEAALLQLEENPTDEEAVNTVFRAFHTVKGTSAFLGLTRIAAFAHEAESLLSRVRDKEIAYTRGCADLSLRSVDMLKELLNAVVTALGGDGRLPLPDGYHALLDALAGYDPARDAAGVELPTAPASGDEIFPAPASAPAASAPAPSGSTQSAGTAGSSGGNAAGANAAANASPDATIRVRTDRLDRLIDMVGELVIAQSMIAGDEALGAGKAHELARKVTHAGKIVRELQDLSMSMRMVPLRATFQKLTRVVRDTASKAGKTVQFLTDGEDVEIDRNLVDRLGDPLVHMVRNAVDHGVEPPNERVSVGKPALGKVRLHAYHASGNVVVELIDDGRGLHRDKIVKKAIEKGLIESDKGMSDSDVFNLIFAPGFSTAEKITDISGRGVGMDVVRRNLEAIRGRIEITSAPGKGTTFAIRLPLTLAVTDGMLVRVGAERFIVPLTHIHMSFRPEPSMLSTVVGKGEMVLLRGELMPIIRLHRLFEVPDAVESPFEGLLMIVGDGTKRTALLVDDLLGQQQVVAKALGDGLGKVPGVSGGAVLGDGRVGLILDVNETVALAQSTDTPPARRDLAA
ncbi:MAG: chemotaxis protein CheA [Gemmatimonadetes bacterium]|nr:chemotaxis protein CheA [Gemmatimonadota bacterium]